uniref:ABC transporter permease n=1 Tax=Methyloceanibacter sp. TaxID=1965321 RepID=UPI003561EF5C
MSVTFAEPSTRQGSRFMRGPWVSIASVAIFLLTWFIAAEVAQSRLLPGPGAVLTYIYEETVHGDLLFELGITLWRVVAAFVIAMVIGSALGLLMGQIPAVNRVLDPW